MIKVLKGIGVVVFVALIGLSAHSLKQMHEAGELMEQYNSRRKADVTLIGFGFVGLGVLAFFEIYRVKQLSNRYRYGESRYEEEKEDVTDGLDSTSIYMAPSSHDEWQGRKTRSSRSYREAGASPGEGIWLGLLKAICMVLPLAYIGLITWTLIFSPADNFLAIFLPSVFFALFLISLITLFGISRKKAWGAGLGYVLAMCNLLIFPYGTAVGLFLIMGLVGSAESFQVSSSEKRRMRRKREQRARATAA